MASREVFHFDEFTLDVQERRLLRGAEAVRLSPKAYDVLVALVQQRIRGGSPLVQTSLKRCSAAMKASIRDAMHRDKSGTTCPEHQGPRDWPLFGLIRGVNDDNFNFSFLTFQA